MSGLVSVSFFRNFYKLGLISIFIALFVLILPDFSLAQNMVPAPIAPASENGAQPSITYQNQAQDRMQAQQQNVQMQQDYMLPQPVMVTPPAMDIPSFTPVNGWQITKTSLSQARGLQKMRLPCLMTAEFDNGFIVRISGGGGSVLAMAIDFRQNIFKQGKKYNASVTVGGMTKVISARSFAPNILLFSARDWSSFYGALMQSTDMIIDVEGNVMRFVMSDMVGGLKNLEQCFDPSAGRVPAPAYVNPIPSVPEANWQSPKMPALSNQPNLKSGDLQVGRKSSGHMGGSSQRTQIWSASAGENLDAVLARWGNQAGVDVQWQAGAPIPVQSDFQFRGGFTQAVQTLMAQNAAISGLKANLVGDIASAVPAPPTPLTPMGGGSISSNDTRIPLNVDNSGRWSAPVGASLQGILSLWAQKEGVEFVWQSSQNFALKRGVNSSGSFETAVQSVLEQFANEMVSPMARLNTDPKTGQRVLFVFSSRG